MNAHRATTSWLALFLAGCAGDPTRSPRAPLEAGPTFEVTEGDACQLSAVYHLSFIYFPATIVPQAVDLIDAMAAAGARTPAARAAGFDLFLLIAQVVEGGATADPAFGSDLTNELIKCMFMPADFPADFPADYRAALDPALDGAFAVRGPTPDAAPVLARGAFAFSGVAPQAGMQWADVLDERVLIAGERTGPETYDWFMVRPGASFDPPVVVGICVESGGTSMLAEENVGVLAFVDPTYFLPCPNLLAAGWAPSPARPLARLARLATRLLGPAPLHAATLMPGGTGGLAGGLRSLFEPIDLTTVGNVVLAFTVQPVDARVNDILSLVQVQAATGEGTPVAGVQVSLVAVDNNGDPVQLGGTTSQVTGPNGLASFTDLALNKSGAYRLVASGTVLGRPGIDVAGARSQKFNIRPRRR